MVNFIEAGSSPIYIGFGSSSSNYNSYIQMVLAAIAKTKQRSILFTGESELENLDLPDMVFKVKSVPFDWLFPRVSGVIHHGGAGTMAAALRAGIPCCTIPFQQDQPFWSQRVAELGVGLAPIYPKELTTEKIATAIEALTNNENIKAKAKNFGEKIRAEDGVANAIKIFNQYLPQ